MQMIKLSEILWIAKMDDLYRLLNEGERLINQTKIDFNNALDSEELSPIQLNIISSKIIEMEERIEILKNKIDTKKLEILN